VLANDPAYQCKKILVVTGERGQKSPGRAKYEETEPHRTDSNRRTVPQWRPILDWKEERVWNIIERWRVRPHPAYQLGWGRTSCLACIFGDDDQWASVKLIAESRFRAIADLERRFRTMIKKGQSVEEMAWRGQEFVSVKPEELQRLANLPNAFTAEMFMLTPSEVWKAPSGTYTRCSAPTCVGRAICRGTDR
jgi:3'-phosphoadenosine 5'-phosphosulfate sulfotransferase (PAPS reductase)/FAD synthetase